MRVELKILIALTLSFQASCATVVRGTSEPFMVVTEPAGATVTTTFETPESKKARKLNATLEPQTYGCSPTPCEIKLPRRSKFIAKVEKPGFDPVRVTVLSKAGGGGKAAGSALPATTIALAASEIAAANTTSVFFLADGAWQIAGATTGAFMIGAPAMFIDAASGAMLSLYPNPVGIKITPASESVDTDKIKTQLTELE